MSELKQVFKKAIQTFIHARDFIVSRYEGVPDRGGNQRSDGHRTKLYEEDYEARQLIETKIEGAVAPQHATSLYG
jgi:hypothetical protein